MKIGLVGCGVAIKGHIPAIRNVPGTEIVGICDINEEKVKKVADLLKIQNSYTYLGEMLEQQKPEIVHIMTPPRTHASLAIKAMQIGCHVLVEKPMGLSAKEAHEMIRAAEGNSVKLCVMHNHLFDPPILKAKEMLYSGLMGEILYVEVRYCLDKDKMIDEGLNRREHWAHQLPIGIFGEYTPHLIYLLLSFIDNVKSVQVSRKQANKSSSNPINGINIQLHAKNAMGHIMMLDNMEYGDFTLDIYGSKLALHINMLDLTITIERERNLPKRLARMYSTVEQSFQNILGTGQNIANITLGKLKRRPGHRMLIKRFYESIRNNSEPPVTGEEGKEVVRVIELIQEQLTDNKF